MKLGAVLKTCNGCIEAFLCKSCYKRSMMCPKLVLAQVTSHVSIPFSKQTLYRAMIVRSTLDGCREAHAAMLAAAAAALATQGCPPRPAPGSPCTILCFQGGAASADNSADGSAAALCAKADAGALPNGGGSGACGAPERAQGPLGGPAECIRHAPQGGPLGMQTPARAGRVAGRVRGDPGTPRGEGWDPARTPRTHRRQRSRHAAPSPGCAALPARMAFAKNWSIPLSSLCLASLPQSCCMSYCEWWSAF